MAPVGETGMLLSHAAAAPIGAPSALPDYSALANEPHMASPAPLFEHAARDMSLFSLPELDDTVSCRCVTLLT